MTIKEIYIARHGYRMNWLPPPHPPNPTGVPSDPPLAPHGVDQAKELAAFLSSLPTKDQPQFIMTSPFYRCVETAQPIAQTLDLKVHLDRGVGEWFKKGRKIVPEPADYGDLTKFFSQVLDKEEVWPRDRLGVVPNLEGETGEEIYSRATQFWHKFIPIFEKEYPDIENILIVTHAATKIALGSVLLKLGSVTSPIDGEETMLRAGACSLSKYVRITDDANDFDWKLVMNGNCEFLTKGEEMNWDFTTGVEAGSAEDIARRKKEAEAKEKQQQSQSQEEGPRGGNGKKSSTGLEGEVPVTEAATGVSETDNMDEYETFYITVDLPNVPKRIDEEDFTIDRSKTRKTPRFKHNVLKPSARLQMTSLGDESPLVKISNNTSNTPNASHGVAVVARDISHQSTATTVTGTSEGRSSKAGKQNNSIIDASTLIDGRIFETNWHKLTGSELIFDDYGELIGRVKEHLTCNDKVKFTPIKKTSYNDGVSVDFVDFEEEDPIGDDSTVKKSDRNSNSKPSPFLRNAIKVAKRKEYS
ncbi:TFC7 [Candida theae]|uniref:TFC7 n=1 Tax=Candida theae TaxID=1198502 RepID=A0AAD5BBT1_9ASCO|nr:TFC7 [Candida theae]KAI5952158.1 TFC7 [Candida theae]